MSNPTLPGDLKRTPDPMRLGDALRALPQVRPERSAWPELAARLAEAGRHEGAGHPRAADAAPRRTTAPARRRYFVPAALAAAVLLAVVAGERLRQPHATAPAREPVAATVAPGAASMRENAANSTNATNGESSNIARLQTLQQRSQALEHWLHETARAGGPLAGQDLAAATEIEDMIGLVDLQLGAPARDGDVALWKRRVALLEDLTALRYSSYTVAENEVAASTSANWTN